MKQYWISVFSWAKEKFNNELVGIPLGIRPFFFLLEKSKHRVIVSVF